MKLKKNSVVSFFNEINIDIFFENTFLAVDIFILDSKHVLSNDFVHLHNGQNTESYKKTAKSWDLLNWSNAFEKYIAVNLWLKYTGIQFDDIFAKISEEMPSNISHFKVLKLQNLLKQWLSQSTKL